MPGSKKSGKKSSSGGDQEDATHAKVSTTPKKEDQRGDGHFSTPKKSKLDFDFWGVNKSEDNKAVSSSNSQAGSSKLETCVRERVLLSDLRLGNMITGAVEIRVTFKSPKKVTKIGNMFEFHGIDESGEIAFVCYPTVFEKFVNLIQMNGLYRIHNFTIVQENPLYPTGAGSGTLQINLRPSTIIAPIDDPGSILGIPFNFSSLDELNSDTVGAKIDACGILVRVWDPETVTSSNTGNVLTKRDIAVTDKSKAVVLLTLWGSTAEEFNVDLFSAIVVRKACLSDFGGKRSLNALSNTLVWVNSDLQEARDIQDWFNAQPMPKQQYSDEG